MADHEPGSGVQALEQLATFVVEEMKRGTDRENVRTRLVAGGLPEEVATELVDKVYAQAAQVAQAERFTAGSLLPAIIGGSLAAVAGGLVWGLIAVTTGYEIGWLAWGVGLLAGWGVVMFAKGRKGLPLQLVAVSAAVLGLLIGKYVTFYSALKEYVADEYGVEAVAQMSMLSPGVVQIFGESLSGMLSGFDALWIVLAVGTAWGIPKVKGLQQADAPAQ